MVERVDIIKYNIKATFFVSGFSKLDSIEIQKLKKLSSFGNEIGNHSRNHLNVLDVLEKKNIQYYLKTEIFPEIKAMKQQGFSPTSFAYPYGLNNEITDKALVKYFSLLRDVTEAQRHFYSLFFENVTQLDEVYFNSQSSRIISALNIDENSGISIDDIKKCFIRAKNNNEIVLFYAHTPVKKVEANCEISYSFLESIFIIAKKMRLRSYRFKDLDTLMTNFKNKSFQNMGNTFH